MKRCVIALCMVFAALAAQAEITAKVTLRFPEIFGLGKPRAEIEVMNNTGFVTEIFAISERVATLRPGQSAVDTKAVIFENAPEPMVAFLFNGDGAYVGCEVKTLYLHGGTKAFWEIGDNVSWAPGEPNANDRPGILELPVEASFPHIWWKGTNVIQFVNITNYDVYVRKSGTRGMGVLVENGDLFVIEAHQTPNETPQRFFVEIRFFRGSVFIDRWVREFYSSPNPKAEQVVIGYL